MRTAVFGGTFDPPHRGHVMLAKELLKMHLAERVMFVPSPVPPHKTNKAITPFHKRVEMLELTLCNDPACIVSEIEKTIGDASPSYTFDTMSKLLSASPREEFFLLIGGDSLRQLHTWHRATQLVEQFELIVYPRGAPVSRRELMENWQKTAVETLLKSQAQLPLFDISSTQIRNGIANNQNVDKFIDIEVVNYIKEHKLYTGAIDGEKRTIEQEENLT